VLVPRYEVGNGVFLARYMPRGDHEVAVELRLSELAKEVQVVWLVYLRDTMLFTVPVLAYVEY
jgi:hypothetical protein